MQIKLQVALITPLLHVKGYGAPETKAAMEQARLLMEQAEALGEPAEDPLLLFSVLYALGREIVAFNGDAIRELAAQFLALAQKQGATLPLMLGHRIMATTLLSTGDIARCREHYDQSLALYEPVEHRAQAMRFGQDARLHPVLPAAGPGCWATPTPRSPTRIKRSRKPARSATQLR